MKTYFTFEGDWNDMVFEEETDEPITVKFTIAFDSADKNIILSEIEKAFTNWLHEECEDSILLDENTSTDDLVQICIIDYMRMWLDKLELKYEVINIPL